MLSSAALIDQTLRSYRLVRRLGDGGMGSVYLARVTKSKRGLKSGDEVAIKVLHPHLAEDRDVLKRFKREAGLGLSLRHPRLVETLDVGSDRIRGQELHFLVMELLRGRTLRELLAARRERIEESFVVNIARQVAEGLAAIHRRGIIHRDIKPSNVFVDGDDQVKIADLGLSRLLSPQTEISLPGTFLGSVAYAAPEQSEGDDVGPAADVYALGVTMYELLSGENPFTRRDLQSTMDAHARFVPKPLVEVIPGKISYFVESVVQTLLDKDPANRIVPASRLAEVLELREASEWWREFIQGDAGPDSDLPRRHRVKRRTRLYGRDAALEAVVDALRTAAVGRAAATVVIDGEAGVGKTRLIDAALERAEREQWTARVLVSRFLDLSTPAPYYALNATLLEAFGLDGVDRVERHSTLIRRLREHLPERKVFAEPFAELIDDRSGESSVAEIPREAIPALYAEVFRTLSVREPLFVVIEGLQWADRGSLRVLEKLVESISVFPIALLLSARPESFPGGTTGEERASFVGGLMERPETVHLSLERLDREAIFAIVEDLGVPDTTRELLTDRLFAASEGNPGVLFALVEDLDWRGRLRSGDRAALQALRLPSSIVDLLRRRIEDLDPEALRFLEFASVFGNRFKVEPVVEVLSLDLVTASEILARLTRRYRVIHAQDRAYRFDHHLLREQIYRGIPAERRRDYHRAVADTLVKEVSDPRVASRGAYESAIHYSIAECHAEAARHLIGAVRYLMARSLYERAERMAQQARAHLEKAPEDALPPGDRFRVHTTLAAVAGHLGHRAEQGGALRRAARVAYAAADDALIADVEVLLARHASATGMFLSALQCAHRARTHAARIEDPGREGAGLRVEASVLSAFGQTDYEELLRRADELAVQAGDERGRAFGALLLGQLYLATDHPATALSTLKGSLRLFEGINDQRGRGRLFFQLARTYREFGDIRRAQKAVDVARHIAEANNDGALRGRCRYLIGDLAMRRRSYVEAEQELEKALVELRAADDKMFEVYVLVALSLLFTASGFHRRDPQEAVRFANEAVDVSSRMELARQEAYAYAALAIAYKSKGRDRSALAVSRRGLRLLERASAGRKRAAELHFVHYRCLKALKRREEAEEHLGRARDLVQERAQEIEEDVYRRSFLKNDLFNAAVLKEAKRVLGKV